jgi:hypothetical protein
VWRPRSEGPYDGITTNMTILIAIVQLATAARLRVL